MRTTNNNIALFRGNWLGCLFSMTSAWTAHVDTLSQKLHLVISTKSGEQSFDLVGFHSVCIRKGWLWSTVCLSGFENTIQLTGLWRWRVSKVVEEIEANIVRSLAQHLNATSVSLDHAHKQVDRFLAQDRYIRYSDVMRFEAAIFASANSTVKQALVLLNHPYARNITQAQRVKSRVEYISGALNPKSPVIRHRNERFVVQEIDAHRAFFDAVEKTPLTEEQRKAAVIFEDRNLLVAAAGSGKSSTLVGKAGYAVQRGLFHPNEIISLAFNRDAALELNERINSRIKPWLKGKSVKAHTFHALGAAIVRKIARDQGRKTRVSTPKEEKPRLQAVLNQLMRDSEFLTDWVLFLSLCREPIPAIDAFSSKEDYDNYIEQQRKAHRNGKPAAFKTLSGAIVRSGEELAIANWLFIQGVPFEYEQPFSPLPDGWGKYQPDFYYPDIKVWHEHFALNGKGEAPKHFVNYAKDAEFKRKWLTQHTADRWFETRSYQYREGTLFDRLESSLKEFGQEFHPKTNEEILACIQQLGQTDALDLFLSVFHLVKGNGVDPATFERCIAPLHDTQRARRFNKVFWPLYDSYNQRLCKEGKIDFDDMIVQAAEYLEQGAFRSQYKLVLVDEFQDLSKGRARLVKALLAQHADSVLFGVGDDWQAINGFAGSNLDLFMKFESVFGATYEGVLTKTFRCSQGIADVGAIFIQRNNNQKPKQVTSELDKTVDGVVDLIDVGSDDDIEAELDRQLSTLATQHKLQSAKTASSKKTTVYLLSRYGLKNTAGFSEEVLDKFNKRFVNELEIEFMTMHKSKGLEADYVFLLGLNAGSWLTFPSTMTNDPFVDMLLTNNDPFPFAEERRLFYVALTRAKKRAFVLFSKVSPSPFVLELMDPRFCRQITYRGGQLPNRCKCEKGFMVRKKGKFGEFFGCTSFRSKDAGCQHTLKILA